MRSRVTAKLWPTSSRVCSLPSPTPNRILMTFSSRGVSVFSTDSVCSLRFRLMTASAGDTTARSSMKSPKWESSSSPIGVSSEIGSCAIFSTLRTFATGMSMRLAISSEVGSRPSSCTSWRDVRISLLMVSIMCTGMRMVRAWSAMARVMAWRIHQVVGREFVAAAVLELVDRLHQADVALLNEVEELQSAVGVLLGDGDDQPQVGLDELAFGALRVH